MTQPAKPTVDELRKGISPRPKGESCQKGEFFEKSNHFPLRGNQRAKWAGGTIL